MKVKIQLEWNKEYAADLSGAEIEVFARVLGKLRRIGRDYDGNTNTVVKLTEEAEKPEVRIVVIDDIKPHEAPVVIDDIKPYEAPVEEPSND